jgi:hypothetical protein
VKGLCDGDRVRARAGQRHRLCRPIDRPRTRRQRRPHLGDRLHRDHLGAGGEQGTRELAGPGGQVDHSAARAEAKPRGQ